MRVVEMGMCGQRRAACGLLGEGWPGPASDGRCPHMTKARAEGEEARAFEEES
jgi:hypothetical protein